MTRDVQSGPPEASLVAALPGEVSTDRAHSGQFLYPGEQDLGKGIPGTGRHQQTNPDIAGGSSQQFSLERETLSRSVTSHTINHLRQENLTIV